ncbi:hypothetical protein ACFQH1_09230 [Lactiplantibacillus daoliensis]|uniref:ABC transporter permease n=1 Tax=Lactiplantibacillus daoliensis TaxID=2559916 RepID=A0ABW1UJB9_9LACO|nr:hypothetical protein [Lactiplantibacillus daoliensis]
MSHIWYRFDKKSIAIAMLIAMILPAIQFYQRLTIAARVDNRFWDSPFTLWMGVDNFSFSTVTYYLLVPLIAALPVATVVRRDLDNGFLTQLRIKGTLKVVLRSYLTWSFILGGLVVAVPLLINLISLALVYPSVFPDNLLNQNILVINRDTLLVSLYYNHPWLHSFLSLLVVFFWGGLFAMFTTTMSLLLKNRFLALSSGLLLQLFLMLIQEFGILKASIAPIDFIKQSASSNIDLVITLEVTLAIVIVILILWQRGVTRIVNS